MSEDGAVWSILVEQQKLLCSTNYDHLPLLEQRLQQWLSSLQQPLISASSAKIWDFLVDPLLLHLSAPSSLARFIALQGIQCCVASLNTFSQKRFLLLADRLTRCVSADWDAPYRSERTRLLGVGILTEILQRFALSLDAEFWNAAPSHRGLLGWILSQALEWLSREQEMRQVRSQAIQCALLIFKSMQTEPRVAASFLPGYLSALHIACCGDFKQSEDFTLSALEGLTDAMVWLFNAQAVLETHAADPFASLRAIEPHMRNLLVLL